MTRNDKKTFVRNTQANIIETYKTVFEAKRSRVICINGEASLEAVEKELQKKVVDIII